MQRLFTFALAIGCVGTSAVLIQRDRVQASTEARSVAALAATMANDAAFRDGLYLGQLARAAQTPAHPPVGRWSTEKDRASFVAGFRRAFDQPTR